MKTKIGFALAALSTLLLSGAIAAQQGSESPERQIFNAANDARRAQGLMRLKWNDSLARAARQHRRSHGAPERALPPIPQRAEPSGKSLPRRPVFHFDCGEYSPGLYPENISDQWVKSPQHRQNLLDPDMNVIGVGIAERDGQLFAVEDFAKIKPQ